jgi:hypothetical protein
MHYGPDSPRQRHNDGGNRRQVREGVLTPAEMATFVPVQMLGAPLTAPPHSGPPPRQGSLAFFWLRWTRSVVDRLTPVKARASRHCSNMKIVRCSGA